MISIIGAQWLVRIIGLIEFIIGICIWLGIGPRLIKIHIILGTILTIILFYLVYHGYKNVIKIGLVDFAFITALGLPVWAISHIHIFVNSWAWVGHLLHLLCAITTIGVSEVLVITMNRYQNSNNKELIKY